MTLVQFSALDSSDRASEAQQKPLMIRSAATIATAGALWSVAGNAASQTVAFVILVILARLLGPDIFGLVAIAMIMISLTQTIVADSFGEALIREPVLSRAHCNAAFLLVIALSFSLIVLLATAAQAIARTFGHPAIAQLIYWLLPLTLMSGLTAVPAAIIRREMRLRELEIRNFAPNSSKAMSSPAAPGVGTAA